MVLVGGTKDSQTYVEMKAAACREAGIRFFSLDLPGGTTETEVLDRLHHLNSDPDVHGEPPRRRSLLPSLHHSMEI